jgi:hypothetical protein
VHTSAQTMRAVQRWCEEGEKQVVRRKEESRASSCNEELECKHETRGPVTKTSRVGVDRSITFDAADAVWSSISRVFAISSPRDENWT